MSIALTLSISLTASILISANQVHASELNYNTTSELNYNTTLTKPRHLAEAAKNEKLVGNKQMYVNVETDSNNKTTEKSYDLSISSKAELDKRINATNVRNIALKNNVATANFSSVHPYIKSS